MRCPSRQPVAKVTRAAGERKGRLLRRRDAFASLLIPLGSFCWDSIRLFILARRSTFAIGRQASAHCAITLRRGMESGRVAQDLMHEMGLAAHQMHVPMHVPSHVLGHVWGRMAKRMRRTGVRWRAPWPQQPAGERSRKRGEL